jgi:hypothetical protein
MSKEPLEALDQQLESYQSVGRRRLRQADQATADARHEPTAPGAGSPAWMRFAAAAGASLAAASDADAAIQHVTPNPAIRVNLYGPSYAYVDLDGVGGDDLLVSVATTYPVPYPGVRLIGHAYGLGGATMIGDNSFGPFSSVAVRQFNSGDTIPAVAPALSGTMLYVSATSNYVPVTFRGQFGAYFGTNTGIAGFVNDVGGSLHAGWIKIRTEPFNLFGNQRLFAVSILEWAYEDVPGKSIKAGQIVSAMGVPGDYNNNGVVDAADYTVWRDHLGQTFQLNNENPGDGNPGVVDVNDYNYWKSQFGNSGSGAGSGALSEAGAVPEPSTISLGVLALGAAGVAALRRRRSTGQLRDSTGASGQ